VLLHCEQRSPALGGVQRVNVLLEREQEEEHTGLMLECASRVAVCGSNGSITEPRDSPNEPQAKAHQAAFHQHSIGAPRSIPLLKRCPEFTHQPQVRGAPKGHSGVDGGTYHVASSQCEASLKPTRRSLKAETAACVDAPNTPDSTSALSTSTGDPA